MTFIKVAVMGSSGYIGANLQRIVSTTYDDIKIIPVSRHELEGTYSQYHAFDFLDSYRRHWARESYYDTAEDEYFDIVRTHDVDELVGRLQNADVLVNLSGSGRQSALNPYHTSVQSPAAVAAFMCKEADGIPIIHMSGLGASPSVPIAYLAAKYEAETIIKKSGLSHVILRPSYVVGRGDYLSSYITQHAETQKHHNAKTTHNHSYRSSTGAPSVDVYHSSHLIQPIHIDDVVSVIIWAVRNTVGKICKTLDLVGPDRIPFYEYMSMLAENAKININPISMSQAYEQALKNPSSAPFGVDDLGIITGGYTGNYNKLVKTTGIKPMSIMDMLSSGGLL